MTKRECGAPSRSCSPPTPFSFELVGAQCWRIWQLWLVALCSMNIHHFITQYNAWREFDPKWKWQPGAQPRLRLPRPQIPKAKKTPASFLLTGSPLFFSSTPEPRRWPPHTKIHHNPAQKGPRSQAGRILVPNMIAPSPSLPFQWTASLCAKQT